MTILVMRPVPDNEKTAAALRAIGYDVLLSPSLRFEALPLYDDHGTDYDAVIVTSANALRGIEDNAILARLRGLTLFAVGDASAEISRQFGFEKVLSASGDGGALRELVTKKLRKGGTVCYLAGADLGRDLTTELGERGYTVVTHTTYRMIPIPHFTDSVKDALTTGGVDAVVHYSRRSAKNFVEAVQTEGIEVTALSLPQCCISGSVAAVLREAGASQVLVAQSPDEPAIFEALGRAVPPGNQGQKI
jgi:uroporphyrinogen-III synthase